MVNTITLNTRLISKDGTADRKLPEEHYPALDGAH